jgi:hypothetical protein
MNDGHVLIRIEGAELPGRDCAAAPGFPGYRNIYVGLQARDRRDELLGRHPGDALTAIWEVRVTATSTDAGWDLRGPYVQGRPGGRWIYLSWGTTDDAGAFTMFRRAKLHFDGIDPNVLHAAVQGGLLVGRLGLTDAKGHPLCAAVRPPLIEWSAA